MNRGQCTGLGHTLCFLCAQGCYQAVTWLCRDALNAQRDGGVAGPIPVDLDIPNAQPSQRGLSRPSTPYVSISMPVKPPRMCNDVSKDCQCRSSPHLNTLHVCTSSGVTSLSCHIGAGPTPLGRCAVQQLLQGLACSRDCNA